MIQVYNEYLTAFILTWIALVMVIATIIVAVIIFSNPKTKDKR